MRAFAEKVYGVPREQVIGSRLKTKVEAKDGKPVLMRIPEIDFIDDGNGKPLAIQDWIGRRPCAAFGNSDGDLAMLEWTWAGDGARLGMFVHHTDAEREYAYDRKSAIGTLNIGLDVSEKKGWPMIDMKKDWKTIFPR